jgi:deazaflavin-dependent oxidoreductase (nitroreductase family)
MAKQYRIGFIRGRINKYVSSAVSKGKLDDNMFLLTTLGRKSGLERTTPVTLLIRGDERYLVSPFGTVGWVYNIRDSGVAELHRGGEVEEITVTELGADAAGPILRQYVRENKIVRSFFDAGKDDPPEVFSQEALRHPVFLIDR